MNKQMKQLLENVITAIVEGDTDAAKTAFHEYLRMKTQNILLGEAADDEDDEKKSEEDCDDECDEDDKDKKKSDKKSEEDCEM